MTRAIVPLTSSMCEKRSNKCFELRISRIVQVIKDI